MPFRMIAFITKIPSINTEDFLKYYEEVHMPLVKAHAGSTFPNFHRRLYTRDNIIPHVGSVDYDCIVELEFEDQAAFQAYFKAIGAEDIQQDSDKFIDAAKNRAYVVEEHIMTRD